MLLQYLYKLTLLPALERYIYIFIYIYLYKTFGKYSLIPLDYSSSLVLSPYLLDAVE